MDIASGKIDVDTSASGTDYTVSGLSFQPKWVFLFWNGKVAGPVIEQDVRVGVGVMAETIGGRAFSCQWDHANAAAGVTDSIWWGVNNCVVTLTIAGVTEGVLRSNGFTSDGFSLDTLNDFAAGFQLGWIAVGGNDVTDVELVDFTLDTGAGTQNVATSFALDTGLDDKAIIFFGGLITASTSAGVNGRIMLGVAAGNTPINAVSMAVSLDAVDPSQSFSYSRLGECIAFASADNTIGARANVSAWLSTGFTINRIENNQASGVIRCSALVIKGGRYEIGSITTSTGITNQTEATTYTPKGLILGSCNRAEDVADTTTPGAEFTVGVAASPTSRHSMSVLTKDAAATSDCGAEFKTDAMYSNLSIASTIAIEGLGDLVSFDATPGFTWVMDDADPVASFVWYLSLADVPNTIKNSQHYLSHIGGLI